MKFIAVAITTLSLALTATAAPSSALEKRWCHPVCCCTTSCTVGELCTIVSDDYISYCCEQDLLSVSRLPTSAWDLVASGIRSGD